MDHPNVALVGKSSESHDWNNSCKKNKEKSIKLFINTVNWTKLLLINVSLASRLTQNNLANIMNLTPIWCFVHYSPTIKPNRTTNFKLLKAGHWHLIQDVQWLRNGTRKKETKSILLPKHYFIAVGFVVVIHTFLWGLRFPLAVVV